ncbi:hypothetical protein DFH08DRAFT_721486, partial [Mycena albidolilacea]
MRNEVKGCLRKDESCLARFPRNLYMKTEVDPNNGSIQVKKLEPMISCVTPDVTYCLRCNTDVTSLLSGTSIKAVVAYISDYVTKSSLKIYHMFQTVKAVLDNNTENIGSSKTGRANSRVMIMQMVNSLTSKLQIGSPMASLYLLGNPDHYTNFAFKVVWWKSYVTEVNKAWNSSAEEEIGDELERVVLVKSENDYVGSDTTDDYVHGPAVFEDCSLFEFLQIASRKKRTKKQMEQFLKSMDEREPMDADVAEPEDDDFIDHDLQEKDAEQQVGDKTDAVSAHPFIPTHPLYRTHYLRCDKRDLELCVPNFVGGPLPRRDEGDREYYCCTMLTLFKPWRSGGDLKNAVDNWSETFREHNFSAKALRLMNNFNIRYECNDARDDFSALDRRKRRALPLFSKGGSNSDSEDEDSE